ncbi:MAG: helix-turn-helix domain-containing protein [Pseudonocardiaceae bacterium]
MDAEEARTIGYAVWRVRADRRKSLQVIADLAGMSKSHLSRIERGERSPTLAEIVALAAALQISVSELTRLPVPAPANGHTDSTTGVVQSALDGIESGEPGGIVLPWEVLQDQVRDLHRLRRACRFAEVAAELPGLIRNLHTTLDTGADHGELLDLAVYLHVHVTKLWLAHAAAPTDLRRRTVFLARRLAQERDQITTLGMAEFAVVDALLGGGAIELGRSRLDAITVPPTTTDTAGLVCDLTMQHAWAAVRDGRPDEAVAPMDTAAELAGRFEATAEADPLGFIPVPADVALHRMGHALEVGDSEQVVRIAAGVAPESHPHRVGQAQYWRNYGRALAGLRGRHDDAVRALRTAENLFPAVVLRDPFVRDTLAVLLRHSRRDAVGQELQGMARRAGLSG